MLELEELYYNGDIESFSPLITNQQITRSIPNDEDFNDQWHLRNTGQTSGTSGEDANVTSVWNSYTGTGIIISVVDDGLDKDHPDIFKYFVKGKKLASMFLLKLNQLFL